MLILRYLKVYSGYNGQQWLNDLFSFDLGTKEWHSVDQSGRTPTIQKNHVEFENPQVSHLLQDLDTYLSSTTTFLLSLAARNCCALQITPVIRSSLPDRL